MTTRSEEQEKETGRVEAFSDGVFAIAITLLVLEFKVPELPVGASNGDLLRALANRWPSLVAFLGSFVAILIMWINHHGLFRMIHRVDRSLLYANGFLLLLVTFVPFPTAVLAAYLGQAGERAAAFFYCGTFVFVSIGWQIFWAAASRRELLKKSVSDETVSRIWSAYRWGFVVYTAAALLALWNAAIGLCTCLSLWVLWTVLEYRVSAAD